MMSIWPNSKFQYPYQDGGFFDCTYRHNPGFRLGSQATSSFTCWTSFAKYCRSFFKVQNVRFMMRRSFPPLVILVRLLALVRATLMPCKTSTRTDPLPCCQLIDLLKETGGLEKEALPTHEQHGI